jgi:penicillin-binding protein 1A
MASKLWHIYHHEIPHVLAPKDYRPHLKSRVFADNGELIAEFGSDDRILTPFEAMPKRLIQAFIAAEDKHFYSHWGIDLRGIIASVTQVALAKRSTLRGASTLTQQLAKGLLVKSEGYSQATARTFSRKIKEALLALKLERHLSKDEILYMYLNEVYLGHGSYGVSAAALNYFHKELKALSLGEMALLAGLPQAPSRFSPQNNMKAALLRQAYVLSRMKEDGFISETQLQEALAANSDLEIFAREDTFKLKAPYFSEHIRRQLLEEYDYETLHNEGLQIYTTLDIDREIAMQKALKKNLIEIDKRQGFLGPLFQPADEQQSIAAKIIMDEINQKNLLDLPPNYLLAQVKNIDINNQTIIITTHKAHRGIIKLNDIRWARPRDPTRHYERVQLTTVEGLVKPHDIILVREHEEKNRFVLEQEPLIEGAMLALEPDTGYVQAMNGGYAFERSEFNRAYQACRMPGSVFKPIVYAAALAKNYTPATMVLDAPLTFRDSASESSWKPKNIEQRYKGEVTLREALIHSMNVPTLNITADIGINTIIDWAAKLGISSTLKHELGTGIGSSCVTPWDLAKVFMVIANLGEVIEPIFIKEIIDRDHKRLRFSAHHKDPWIKREDRLKAAFHNFHTPKTRVMSEEDAYTMHYLLTEATRLGTGQRTHVLGRTIAGKTGTTNDSYDTWFAGYTSSLLSVVWVGSDNMNMPLGVYEQGGRTAVPIFNAFMAPALQTIRDENIAMPKSMCMARIDERSGLRLLHDHPQSFLAPFRCGHEPAVREEGLQEQNLEQALEFMGAY